MTNQVLWNLLCCFFFWLDAKDVPTSGLILVAKTHAAYHVAWWHCFRLLKKAELTTTKLSWRLVATVATLLNSGGGGAHFGQTTTHPEDLELQLAAGQMVPFLACFCGVFLWAWIGWNWRLLGVRLGVREEGRLGDNHTWIQRFHPVSQVREYVPWRHVLGGKSFKKLRGVDHLVLFFWISPWFQ